MTPTPTPTIFRIWRFSKIHVFLWFYKMPILVILQNPTFCRTPRFDDPYTNPYDFWKQHFDKTHIFLGFCTIPLFGDPENLRFVALLGLMIPTPTPPIFRKRCQDGPIRRSRKTLRFVALFCLIIPKMPIFGDPENPTSCRTPRFDDPSNPYDFSKTVLGFCTMPIIGDPENPTFCSTPRFDDSYTPYDFLKTVF